MQSISVTGNLESPTTLEKCTFKVDRSKRDCLEKENSMDLEELLKSTEMFLKVHLILRENY